MIKAAINAPVSLAESSYEVLKGSMYHIVAMGEGDTLNLLSESGEPTGQTVETEQLPALLGAGGLVVLPNINDRLVNFYNDAGIACFVPARDINLFCSLTPYSANEGFKWEVTYNTIKSAITTLYLSLSTKCNLRCRYCNFHGEGATYPPDEKINMQWDVLHELTNQAKEINTLTQVFLTGRGEVFMNPNWFEMLCYLLENTSIQAVRIFTNAMALTKENVDKLVKLPCSNLHLQFSVDGFSPEDTEYWRINSKYETIKNNVYYAHSQLKDKCFMAIYNTVVLPPGFDAIGSTVNDLNELLEKSKVWINEQFPFVNNVYGSIATVSPKQVISGAEIVGVRAPSNLNICTNRFMAIAVEATGDILSCPCAHDPFKIGNLMEGNMLDLWLNHDKQNQYRKSFTTRLPKCKGCVANPATSTKRHFADTRKNKK